MLGILINRGHINYFAMIVNLLCYFGWTLLCRAGVLDVDVLDVLCFSEAWSSGVHTWPSLLIRVLSATPVLMMAD